MYEVNRSIAVLRPNPPFLAWLAQLPGDFAAGLTLDALRSAGNALLIPPVDDAETARAFVLSRHQSLFEAELADWCEETALWPADRSAAVFADWFDIEIHPVLTDLVDEPLDREAFIPLDLDLPH